LKIAFHWRWDRAKEIYPNWRDGLRGCIEEIAKKHNVDWLLSEDPKKDYDWIITWDDSNSPMSYFFSPQYKAKRGIFLTTNPTNYHNLKGFDVVFCESSVVLNECRQWGIHAVKAFGTDDNFFVPGEPEKRWPYTSDFKLKYFYPATFSPWKLQDEIAYLGGDLLCLGTVQPDGTPQIEACKKNGVKVWEGYFPPSTIRDLYRRTQGVIIPAVHGSERTVLEAMSMNILPEVTNPTNLKSKTYLEEYARSGAYSPREFIMEYYSAKKYAKDVLKGLYDCED
jgi:hypothetical protein